MNPLEYIKALDHHAYFLHSVNDTVFKLKEFLLEKFNIKHEANPDFFYEKFESLGIDDSRRIKEIHLSKSFESGGKRIFIIETSAITHEAQNSLLKMFEEPNEDSHFFLIMPSQHTLLPTLSSRLLILDSKGEITQGVESIAKAEEFLSLPKKDKITFVDEMAKDISDEKLNKSDAIEFLAALEIFIYKKYGTSKPRAMKAILKARDYMNDRSASVKQLLEYVALNM